MHLQAASLLLYTPAVLVCIAVVFASAYSYSWQSRLANLNCSIQDDSFYYFVPAWNESHSAGFRFGGEKTWGFQPLYELLAHVQQVLEARRTFLEGKLKLTFTMAKCERWCRRLLGLPNYPQTRSARQHAACHDGPVGKVPRSCAEACTMELPLFGRTCCGLQITADELAGRLQPQRFVRMNLVVILEPVGQL